MGPRRKRKLKHKKCTVVYQPDYLTANYSSVDRGWRTVATVATMARRSRMEVSSAHLTCFFSRPLDFPLMRIRGSAFFSVQTIRAKYLHRPGYRSPRHGAHKWRQSGLVPQPPLSSRWGPPRPSSKPRRIPGGARAAAPTVWPNSPRVGGWMEGGAAVGGLRADMAVLSR